MGEGDVPSSLGGSPPPPPRNLLLLNIPERASRPLSSRENAGPTLPSMPYPTVAPTSLWKSNRHGQPPKTPLAPCTHGGLSKPLTGALDRHHPWPPASSPTPLPGPYPAGHGQGFVPGPSHHSNQSVAGGPSARPGLAPRPPQPVAAALCQGRPSASAGPCVHTRVE